MHKLMAAAPGLRRDSRIQMHASISVGFAMLVVVGLVAVGNVINQLEPAVDSPQGIVIEPAGDVSDTELRQLINRISASIAAEESGDELLDSQLRSLQLDAELLQEASAPPPLPEVSAPAIKPLPLPRPDLPVPPPEMGL